MSKHRGDPYWNHSDLNPSEIEPTLPPCAGKHELGDEQPTETGNLCHRCYRTLRLLLAQLPAVETWLWMNEAAGGSPSERVSGTSEDPIPLRLDVLDLVGPDSHRPARTDAASYLVWCDGALVGSYTSWGDAEQVQRQMWAQYGLEPYSDTAKLRVQVRPLQRGGPDQRGSESFRASLRYWAEQVHDEHGRPWPDDHETVTGLTAYLLADLLWIARQDWASDMLAEIIRTTQTAHQTAPWKAMTRRDKDEICEHCGAKAIVVHLSEAVARCEKGLGGCGKNRQVSGYLERAGYLDEDTA